MIFLFWIVQAFAEPHFESSCSGVCFFRGNNTRTYYGEGDFTAASPPDIIWKYPDGPPMQKNSPVYGVPRLWAGNGWTGQPVVHKRSDGVVEVIVGTYDGGVHFINLHTGKPTRPPFMTGDIIKGTVSLDPDGFPLLYVGSRDRYYRVLSLSHVQNIGDKWDKERDVLLSVYGDIKERKGTSRDWDGNALIDSDYMYLPGENSWFYLYKLNRGYDENGHVQIKPERLLFFPSWKTPTWDESLISKIGDPSNKLSVAIESSPTIHNGVVYFANSGGRIVGLDIESAKQGVAKVVFDFWTGDDVDATLVIDEDGMLYASVEYEIARTKSKPRKLEVGQLVKLNPSKPEDPIVWSLDLVKNKGADGGIWATPAILKQSFTGTGYLYVPLHTGELIGVDTSTGEIVWSIPFKRVSWSSPNIIYKNGKANLLMIDNVGNILITI